MTDATETCGKGGVATLEEGGDPKKGGVLKEGGDDTPFLTMT